MISATAGLGHADPDQVGTPVIRVVVVEDHVLHRNGTRQTLDAYSNAALSFLSAALDTTTITCGFGMVGRSDQVRARSA